MAKFGLDLSKFHKVGGDEKTTTLRHSDGHIMTIAHKALSPKMRNQLSALESPKIEKPRFADGGDVGSEIDYDKLIPQEESANRPYGTPDTAPPTATETPALPPSTPVSPQAPQAGNPTPEVSPLAAQAQQSEQPQDITKQDLSKENPSVMQGYQRQVQAAQMEGAATADMALQQERQLKAGALAQQDLQTQFQNHYKALDDERNNFQQDILNQHIDPNKYLGSKDTVGKVGTAIGLILGGIGSGLAGGPNQALQFLNMQIDRDIDAQKAELGKRETLLSANMRQFGNLDAATNMTRMMTSDIIKTQLQQAAAKAQSPIAKANALRMVGQLEQQTAPMAMQLATRQMLMSGGGNGPGQVSQQDPAKLIPLVVPEKDQPAAYKELQEAQNMASAKNNIMSSFDKIAKLQTLGSKLSNPVQTRSQIAAIKDPLVAGLSKATAGRFTEQDAGMLDSLFPTLTDNAKSVATKKEQIDKLISEKMHFPVLSGNYIDVNKFASTAATPESQMNPQQASMARWAKANPGDPRAALVLKKLGLSQ